MAHIYNGILLSHKKNDIGLFVVRWMDLESVIQAEVSQKEKNKYRRLTHIYGIKKKSGLEKHSLKESILIDIGNNFNRRKSSYLSRCSYVTQEDFSIQSAKTK